MKQDRIGYWGPYSPYNPAMAPYLSAMAQGYALAARAEALRAKIFEVSAPTAPPPPGFDEWRKPGTRRQPHVPRGQGRCKVFGVN